MNRELCKYIVTRDLPEKVIKRAINGIQRIEKSKKRAKICDYSRIPSRIEGAFLWGKTAQGHEFWQTICLCREKKND